MKYENEHSTHEAVADIITVTTLQESVTESQTGSLSLSYYDSSAGIVCMRCYYSGTDILLSSV